MHGRWHGHKMPAVVSIEAGPEELTLEGNENGRDGGDKEKGEIGEIENEDYQKEFSGEKKEGGENGDRKDRQSAGSDDERFPEKRGDVNIGIDDDEDVNGNTVVDTEPS